VQVKLVQRLEPRAEAYARVGRYVFCFGGGGSGFSEIMEQILTQHVSFSYMGAAEYEFGAASRSLNYLHENKSQYILTTATIKRQIDKKKRERDIWIFSTPEQVPEIIKILKTLKEWDTRDANLWVNTLKGEHIKTTGWWDIKNHFMWFVDETQAKFFQDLINDTDKYVTQAKEQFKKEVASKEDPAS